MALTPYRKAYSSAKKLKFESLEYAQLEMLAYP
jgi:hypothetical protein